MFVMTTEETAVASLSVLSPPPSVFWSIAIVSNAAVIIRKGSPA
jgi:hypothetical protein